MKKALFILECLFAIMSADMSVKAQEVTITLAPGWTWISYPSTDTIDFTTAFGSFNPIAGDFIKSQDGYSEYYDGYGWFGSLTTFMPGKGYMYKSNHTEPVVFTVGTPYSQQAVITAEPTDVTVTSAVVGGTVTIGQGNHIFVRGVCWGTEHIPTIDGNHTTDVTVSGNQTVTLDGLIPNTTYYVRAYMVTDYGLSYGEELNFTTLQNVVLPTVTTSQVTNITGTTATGGGNVTSNGGGTVTERGICWSTSHNPTTSGNHGSSGTGTGSYSVSMTGLTANTTYYVRAYATNSAGIAYGNEVSFTTSQIATYTITVSANPNAGGSVSSGGTYQQGQSCTVTATAATGYTFYRWTENGTQVSTNASYTFTVNGNRVLVANFTVPTGAINGKFNASSI